MVTVPIYRIYPIILLMCLRKSVFGIIIDFISYIFKHQL
jgi:hypothetical protein